MTNDINIGDRYGRLTIVSFNKKPTLVTCKCDCGNYISVKPFKLRKKDIRSCGCYFHGKSKSKAFNSWVAMKNRCLNKNTENYNRYGGVGIKICIGLLDFRNFEKLIGQPPTDSHSLDRIKSKLNYSCGECVECKMNEWSKNIKWSTKKEQSRNRGDFIHLISFNGITLNIQEWSEKLNIPRPTLSNRINTYKWSIEKSLTIPIRKKVKQ